VPKLFLFSHDDHYGRVFWTSKQKPRFFNQQKLVDLLIIVETCNQCMNSCCLIWLSIAVSSEHCNFLGKITIQIWSAALSLFGNSKVWFTHCQISFQASLGRYKAFWVASLFPVQQKDSDEAAWVQLESMYSSLNCLIVTFINKIS